MSKTVFLIGKDNELIELLEYVLSGQGYAIHISCSENVLEELADVGPKLILVLDAIIQSSNGIELCKEIKNDHVLNSIPLIIVSAINNLETVAAKCGADDFLVKPFELENFETMVSKRIAN